MSRSNKMILISLFAISLTLIAGAISQVTMGISVDETGLSIGQVPATTSATTVYRLQGRSYNSWPIGVQGITIDTISGLPVQFVDLIIIN